MKFINLDAVVPISPSIPWYFVPFMAVGALLATVAIVKGVAALLAANGKRRARATKTYGGGGTHVGGTVIALVSGIVVAGLLGVNYQTIWYSLNPEYTSPEDNEIAVRAQLAEQGAANLELRATEPRHSLERIDAESWANGQPLHALLVCDLAQVPEAGQFPPYERHSWELPVSYGADGNTAQAAVLERTVTDDECVFTLTDVETIDE